VNDRDEYFARWSALHGGYDPRTSRLTGGWLSMTYVVARPFIAARVAPDVITLGGALLAGVAVWFAALGGRWVLAAAAVIVLSAIFDNVDGAVAVMTDRASRWGYVLDSLVDRVSDCLFLLALWFVGAPVWACVVGGVLMFVLEYARARAGSAGMSEVGVITVWERPTRVIVTTMFLLGAGLFVAQAGGWATAGALAWVGLGVVGLCQLLALLRRRLIGPANEIADDIGRHSDEG